MFAGYRNPHPMEHKILIRIQTTPATTPADALNSAITDLRAELSLFEERFKVSIFIIKYFNLNIDLTVQRAREWVYPVDYFF